MPWPDKQRKAIAARMHAEGKSGEEISAFFRKHGYGKKRRRKRPDPGRRS